jgi:hypothetical protein
MGSVSVERRVWDSVQLVEARCEPIRNCSESRESKSVSRWSICKFREAFERSAGMTLPCCDWSLCSVAVFLWLTRLFEVNCRAFDIFRFLQTQQAFEDNLQDWRDC